MSRKKESNRIFFIMNKKLYFYEEIDAVCNFGYCEDHGFTDKEINKIFSFLTYEDQAIETENVDGKDKPLNRYLMKTFGSYFIEIYN